MPFIFLKKIYAYYFISSILILCFKLSPSLAHLSYESISNKPWTSQVQVGWFILHPTPNIEYIYMWLKRNHNLLQKFLFNASLDEVCIGIIKWPWVEVIPDNHLHRSTILWRVYFGIIATFDHSFNIFSFNYVGDSKPLTVY